MPVIPRLAALWKNLRHRGRSERDLDDEIRAAFELLAADHIRRGLSPDAARRAASIELGGIEQIKEQVRDASAGVLLDSMLRDLRYAARGLRRNPGFAIVATLTIAFGIGANTAIFSVVDAAVLRPLPYAEPDRLVSLWEINAEGNRGSVSAANLVDYNRENTSFDGLAGYSGVSSSLTRFGPPEQIFGVAVTWNNFAVRGVSPRLGRAFTPDEDRPGRDRVVILTDAFWRARFGADPQVLGRTLTLDGASYEVIGVMPAEACACSMDFRSVPQIAFLRPAAYSDRVLADHGNHEINVVGRLKDGVSLRQAQADLDAIMRGLATRHPDELSEYRVAIGPLHDDIVRNVRRSFIVMLGAVGLVLLVACVNVANLMLVRAAGQRREIAIRRALGATRGRILADAMTRSMLLAILGGVAGLVLGVWTRDLLVAMAPATIPRLRDVSLNARVLAVTAGLSMAVGLLAGVLPAWYSVKDLPTPALRASDLTASSGRSVMRWRGLLMAGEIAAAMVLAVCAGLLVRSLIMVNNVELGFETERVLTLRLTLPDARYPDARARLAFFDDLAGRVKQLPGVVSASFANQFPMRGAWGGSLSLRMPQGPVEADSGFQAVSPTFFSTLGMRILRGRGISIDDRLGSIPVAVVSRAFVGQYLGDRDPIGHQFTRGPLPPVAVSGAGNYGQVPGEPLLYTIVGVVDDIRRDGKTAPIDPQVYLPAAQTDHYPVRLSDFAVKIAGDPHSLVAAIQREVWAIDADQPVTNVRTLDEVLSALLAERRFNLGLLACFAVLALGLAMIGVYSVVAYAAAQRSRELAVRIALGATRHDVVSLMLKGGLTFAMAGVAVGLAGSYAATRLLTTLLFGVTATDPLTFIGGAVALLGVALLASYIPARRAAGVDPMVALRCE
jgi:predicted permease